ncbi:MAG: hypothetical protein QNJ33_12770 [Crocosphaera sp.]|nr:hypothetical protein [Crocosphaera sp.]
MRLIDKLENGSSSGTLEDGRGLGVGTVLEDRSEEREGETLEGEELATGLTGVCMVMDKGKLKIEN